MYMDRCANTTQAHVLACTCTKRHTDASIPVHAHVPNTSRTHLVLALTSMLPVVHPPPRSLPPPPALVSVVLLYVYVYVYVY